MTAGIDLSTFNVARPLYLWLLIVPAVLFVAGTFRLLRRRGDVRRSMQDRLLPGALELAPGGGYYFWLLAAAAASLCILALAQPQAVAREMVVETEHALLGKVPIVNRSIKFPGETQPVPAAPPVLGQHTDEVLRDVLGYSAARIEQLRAAGVIS